MRCQWRPTVRIISLVMVLAVVAILALPTSVATSQSVEQLVVADTGGQGARLRERPSRASRTVQTLTEGTRVDVVGTDEQGDGLVWRIVRDQAGNVGWISAALVVTPAASAAADQSSGAAPQRPTSSIQRPPATSPACFDASVRFGYNGDVQALLRRGMLEAGFSPLSGNPYVRQLPQSAPQIVGSWIAVSLLRERRGYSAPTLGQWIKDGYTFSFGLAVEERDEMLSWPTDSCEGAFIWNRGNDDVLRLVGWLVSTSWTPRIPIPLTENSPHERIECAASEGVAFVNSSWEQDRQGYMYISGTLVKRCSHTVRASVQIQPGVAGTRKWLGLSGVILGPGQEYAVSSFKSPEVFSRIENASSDVAFTDCPERIC